MRTLAGLALGLALTLAVAPALVVALAVAALAVAVFGAGVGCALVGGALLVSAATSPPACAARARVVFAYSQIATPKARAPSGINTAAGLHGRKGRGPFGRTRGRAW